MNSQWGNLISLVLEKKASHICLRRENWARAQLKETLREDRTTTEIQMTVFIWNYIHELND